MISEKLLPTVNPTAATRYVASKVGHYVLFNEKGHQESDFTRASASLERERIASLPLSKVGSAALFQYSLEDTSLHIPDPS